MIEVGWMVITSQGPMFWPPSDRAEAETYCEDGAEPVLLLANQSAINAHEVAQGAT
jgi:hypothetical protein